MSTMRKEDLVASVLAKYNKQIGLAVNASSKRRDGPLLVVGGGETNLRNTAAAAAVPAEITLEKGSLAALKERRIKERGLRPSTGGSNKAYTKPKLIQAFKKTGSYVNHTYRDFSSVPAEPNHVEPVHFHEMTIVQKLHRVVSTPEYSHLITWMPHGRSFKLVDEDRLEKSGLLRDVFRMRSLSSFKAELLKHDFKKITKEEEGKTYYHEASTFMCDGVLFVCSFQRCGYV
jgi:HSF-type DNA-binding